MQNLRSLRSTNPSRLRAFVSALSITIVCSPATATDTPDIKAAQQIAEPLLKLGFSTAKLVWLSTTQPSLPKGMPLTVYSNLAVNLQGRIKEGRAAAQVAGASFDIVASTLTYVAVTDPEPLRRPLRHWPPSLLSVLF
ncbi:hypothetical protein GOB57_09540 [Sinorhizobium meliloti]|nr:hypothetical protein [Sinorhizobium meliloti]